MATAIEVEAEKDQAISEDQLDADLLESDFVRRERSLYRDAVRRFFRNRLAILGLTLVSLLVILAVFADDWFIVFVTGGGDDDQAGCEFHEAPFYAYGFETFLRMLRDRIPRLGHPMLAASADFASRVLWPMELDGRPLFDFAVPESRGIIGRIRSALAGSVMMGRLPMTVMSSPPDVPG